MNENRTGRAIKNSIAALGCKALLVIVPFIVRAVTIKKLGVEYLGLNGLFTSILTMLSLSELGFSSAVIYAMYKPVSEGDNEKVCALLTFYKKVYRIVGVVITLIGLAILPFIDHLIASGYPSNVNIHFVYLIFLSNTCLSYFLFAYKNAILVAHMRSDLDSIITTATQILMYLFQIIVLYVFANYYIYAIAFPIFTLLNNIIRSFIVDKNYPQYKKSVSLDSVERRTIVKKVGALFGHKVGGVVFSSFDTIVISSFLGLFVLGKYSNYFYIYTSVNAVISLVFNSILSVIGNSIACRSPEENLETFYEMVYINGWITGLISCLLACIYQPFMYLWVGDSNMLEMTIPFLLATYFYTFSYRRVVLVFKDAAGMWEADMLKPYVSAIINLILNILLVQTIGLPGVVISSIVAVVFVEMPWETGALFKKYFKNSPQKYIKRSFIHLIFTAIVTTGVFFICDQFAGRSVGNIIIKLIICLGLYNILFIFLFYKSDEFRKVLNRVKKIKGVFKQ